MPHIPSVCFLVAGVLLFTISDKFLINGQNSTSNTGNISLKMWKSSKQYATRLPKVIWEQTASPTWVANQHITAIYNCSSAFARWRQCQCAHPPNAWFLEPTPLTIPNGTSISSAVFAWSMPYSHCTLQSTAPFPPQIWPLPWGSCSPI